MKIALIHPRITYRCEDPSIQIYVNHWYKEIFSRAFNINLLRLGSMTPKEHSVTLVDENYQDIDFDSSYDVIAVTAMTYQAERAYEIAAEFKRRGDCRTIMGGIHASVLPEEAGTKFDSVCIGEVENLWEEYLQDVAAGRPKKFYRGELAALEKETPIDYSLVAPWTQGARKDGFFFFPTMSTRGCPRGCDYCSATYLFNKRYRKKEVDKVISDIRAIKQTAAVLGVSQYQVEFCDDNFIIDRARTKDLLHALIPERVSYTASLDIAASDDPEILELLGESGCKVVSIGLESLDVNILQDLGKWKRSQREKVEKNIRAFFDYGITPAVNFMVGSDGTDWKLFLNIRRFLREFPVVFNILFFTPFPGTPYHRALGDEGRLRSDKSWADYNLFNLVFEPKGLTKEELYEEFFSIRSEYNHMERHLKSQKSLTTKAAHPFPEQESTLIY
ncbi:MAG: B12-binding domain-containing radical SAM protein [Deltaproteobacteria bacterium]|nr:B12-binding domain-containing radical SAM protein [Deltaproteobacteria bacterium]